MLLFFLLTVLLRLVVSDPRVGSSNTAVLTDEPDSSNLFPIDLRSIDDYLLSDIILISDIDGSLHCVDRNTGALIWSLPINEPLVKINTNTSAAHDESSNILWFVEPYGDGSLYYFTPEYGLNKLPTSIKQLVLESPFSLAGDDKIYTGTRRASLYTINVRTGEIVSHYGSGDQMLTTTNRDASSNEDYIMIGRTVYELSIHSKENSNVVWNVTFANWGPNNIDNDLILQNQQSLDKLYFTPFHDKSLLAINKDLGTPVWITKLSLLAVSVFDIFHDTKSLNNYVLLPHPLKVLNDLQINQYESGINSELCFVNKTAHSNEWFAMSFNNYPTLIKSAPISKYQLALFKLDSYAGTNINDQYTSDTLRNLKLSDASIETIINGVHRVNNLGLDSTYQPKSRFTDTMKIGGGDPESQDEVALIENNLPIPNIIEGIKFSSSKTRNLDKPTFVPAARTNKGELIRVEDVNEDVEPFDGTSGGTSVKPTATSFLKRVVEDIIIVFGIAAFVYSLNHYEAVVKRLEEALGRPIPILSKLAEPRSVEHESPMKGDPVEEKESSTAEDDNEFEYVDKPIDKTEGKKVTIIEPNDAVENGLNDALLVERVEIFEIENDNDVDVEEVTTKKKRKRGSRGGKRSKKKNQLEDKDTDREYDTNWNDSEEAETNQPVINTTSLVKALSNINKILSKKLQIENNLVISEKILGYGSHGTVVYEGTFENRPVAVKRMLLDFYDVANHEVKLLQESDDHPNVVRYFCSQSSMSEKFLYIALELCQCSLEDLIEKPKFKLRLTPKGVDYSKLLYQLASGLNYLHNLKIVHRDLKPQNILIGDFKSMRTRFALKKADELRLLISDFGLCKKLDHDQSSFKATTQNAASGTSGWRAPELLLSHDILEISPDTVSSISSTSNSINNMNLAVTGQKRLTKAIDIFSLGCVFYYILTGGGHPFGDRYLREGNIIKGEYDLSALDKYKDKEELKHLIALMIAHNPRVRPNTEAIMKHPYFWTTSKKLDFLLKVSDRFEIERRDPPSDLLLTLEASADKVVHGNWHIKFKQDFMDNLGKYRKYQPEKLMDLLRALRNKYHHFNDMPANLQEQMSPLPGGFYEYFNSKFSNLLMEVYFVVEKNLKEEHIFGEFF